MDLTTYEGIAAFSRRAVEQTKRPNCDGTYSESLIDRKDVIKHHELIATACEMQIPLKPKYEEYCTICDTCLIDDNNIEGEWCPNCGRKVDWSDKND